jgi:DNA-binding NarL/FixJ family response regulator
MKQSTYYERNRIARELYDAFASDLAEVSFRIDEAIGLNSTNAATRRSLRKIREDVTSLINKSKHLREVKFELTPREKDVMTILGTGESIKGISETLHLSETTVKTHLASSYRKLGAHNKVEALAKAQKLGLLPK